MVRLTIAYMVMAAVVISRTVDTLGEAVIFLGAIAVALEAIRRVIGKPAARMYRKADSAFDLILAVPSRLDQVERRLQAIEEQSSADLTVRHEVHHDSTDL